MSNESSKKENTVNSSGSKIDKIRKSINKIEISYDYSSNNLIKKFWDFLLFVLVLYSILMTPLNICFFSESNKILLLEIVIEFIFIIEFVLNFFTCIYDVEENEITDFSNIIENFLIPRCFLT